MTAETDHAAVYEATRGRIVALLRGASDGELLTPVAACPGWTVRDLAGHLSGVVADISAGLLDGMAGDEWTARQVAERRGWDLERVATVPKPFDAILVADVCSHEHDLRSDQVRAYDWHGDPAPYLGSFFLFGPAAAPLQE